MSYGETIRKIRVSKGLSQKEVYTGILSKSYAIEFEKGKHNISATLLFMILEQISVGIEEFLYICNNYQLNDQSAYSERYSHYGNAYDLEGLYQLLTELKVKRGRVNDVRKAEVHARIQIITHFNQTGNYENTVVDAKDIKVITAYLLDVETWTLQEILLYTNTIEFIELEAHIVFFKKISKSFPLYEHFDLAREVLCTMCINLIHEALLYEFFDFAEVVILQLFQLSQDYRQFLHHTYAKFYQYVYRYKLGEAHAKVEAQQILVFIEKLDHPALAKELAVLLADE